MSGEIVQLPETQAASFDDGRFDDEHDNSTEPRSPELQVQFPTSFASHSFTGPWPPVMQSFEGPDAPDSGHVLSGEQAERQELPRIPLQVVLSFIPSRTVISSILTCRPHLSGTARPHSIPSPGKH